MSTATLNINSEVTYEKSPLFKAVSCIPLVGMVSSCFSTVTLAIKHDQAKKSGDITGMKNTFKAFSDIKKIDVFRNLVSIALIVGAVAFGILSGPVGITLACLLFLSALHDVCLIRSCNQKINHLSKNNAAS